MSYWIAGAMIVSTAVSAYTANSNAKKQANLQREAMNESKAQAVQQQQQAAAKEKQADEAFNAANRKTPDTNALLTAALAGGKLGGSSTMLTGPGGVDPNKLQLGKTNLLGS